MKQFFVSLFFVFVTVGLVGCGTMYQTDCAGGCNYVATTPVKVVTTSGCCTAPVRKPVTVNCCTMTTSYCSTCSTCPTCARGSYYGNDYNYGYGSSSWY